MKHRISEGDVVKWMGRSWIVLDVSGFACTLVKPGDPTHTARAYCRELTDVGPWR